VADELEPLGPLAIRALEAERARPDAGDAMRDRVLARVVASVGAGAAITAAASGAGAAGGAGVGAGKGAAAGAAASSGASGAAVKMLPWLVAAFVAGGGTGAAIHAAATAKPPGSTPSAVVVPPPATPSVVVATGTSVPTIAASDLPAAPLPSARPTVSSAAPTATGGSGAGHDVDLAAERSLVDRARTALTRGQPGAALEALDSHAKTFPRGRLAEEREALAIDALARAGRGAEAKARAVRFRAAYPQSVFLGVVDLAAPPN